MRYAENIVEKGNHIFKEHVRGSFEQIDSEIENILNE